MERKRYRVFVADYRGITIYANSVEFDEDGMVFFWDGDHNLVAASGDWVFVRIFDTTNSVDGGELIWEAKPSVLHLKVGA